MDVPPDAQYCTVTGAPADPIVEDAPGSSARLVVYPEDGAIVEYNLATKKKTKILTGTSNCGFLSARFWDSTDVVVAEDSSVWIVDTVTGETREVPIVPNNSRVLAIAVSSVFEVAVLSSEATAPIGEWTLTTTGQYGVQTSAKVAWSCGCDPTSLDNMSWSYDGTFLAVSAPSGVGSAVTVYGQDGKRYGKTFSAQLPTWMGSTENLIVEHKHGDVAHFDEVDVDGKIIRHLFTTTRDLSGAVASPDGSKIAFNDDGGTTVYDFRKKAFQMFGGMEMYPLWLSSTSMAVSGVLPVYSNGGISYSTVGPVFSIDLRSGAQHRLGFTQTQNADAWF